MATKGNNLSEYDKDTIPNAKDFRFGIVVSEWNDKITSGLLKGAIDALVECGVEETNIIKWDVPGSFELIYGCKKMIEQTVDAVIAIGCVIKGKTAHFDLISKSVIDAIMDISIESKKPVSNCILTCFNHKQAVARKEKGKEAALAINSILSQ